jgi:hypothetical protein
VLGGLQRHYLSVDGALNVSLMLENSLFCLTLLSVVAPTRDLIFQLSTNVATRILKPFETNPKRTTSQL